MSSKRKIYSMLLVLGDLFVFFCLCVLACLLITKDFNELDREFVISAILLSIGKVIAGFIAGNYNLLWRYSIRRNLVKLLITTFSIDLILLVLSMIPKIGYGTGFRTSIYIALMLMEFFYLTSSRFAISIYFSHFYKRKDKQKNDKALVNTLIIGAGSAGAMVLNEIANRENGFKVVAFLDDSQDKIGTIINNVKVYGPIDNINEYVKRFDIEKIIVAIPTAGMARMKEIVNIIDYKNVTVEILPDKTRLLQSNISANIRKVEVADLLGRTPIELDKSRLNSFINNKVVLVTGGGGSIGSEIARQVLEYNPRLLIIFDIYENSTYELKTELDIKYRNSEIKPEYLCLIGSVREKDRLEEIFAKYNPNIVFHAAAHKHVPLMEDSPYEAIKNNIMGTFNVAEMADKYKVEKMVLISTDKAVNPTNVMGATKRFCEMVVEAWNEHSQQTSYSMVRFGNVLGSNGSVIPLFRKQIEAGGPLTVTHPEINRFFMTIPEACGLVIQSGAYANGGEKFILDMGEPVKIVDLAKNMIKLSGLELGKDIDIEYTGLRPGEKLYEELLLKTANASKTENDKIFVEYCNNAFNLKEMKDIINHLVEISSDNGAILEYLKEIEIKKVK